MSNLKRVKQVLCIAVMLLFITPFAANAQSDACNSADRISEIPGEVAERDAIIKKYVSFAQEVLRLSGREDCTIEESSGAKKRASYDPNCGENLTDSEVAELKELGEEIKRIEKEYNALLVQKLKEFSTANECNREAIRKDIELLKNALEDLNAEQARIEEIFAKLMGEELVDEEPPPAQEESPVEEESQEPDFQGSYNGPVKLYIGSANYNDQIRNLAGYLAGSGKMVEFELGADGVPLSALGVRTSSLRIAEPGVEKLEGTPSWSAVQDAKTGSEGGDIYINGLIVNNPDKSSYTFSELKSAAIEKNRGAVENRKQRVIRDLANNGANAGSDYTLTTSDDGMKTGLLLLSDIPLEEGNWFGDDKYDIVIEDKSQLGASFRYVKVTVK